MGAVSSSLYSRRCTRAIHEPSVTHPHQATEHPNPVNLTVPLTEPGGRHSADDDEE
jgi:hypothetical protein